MHTDLLFLILKWEWTATVQTSGGSLPPLSLLVLLLALAILHFSDTKLQSSDLSSSGSPDHSLEPGAQPGCTLELSKEFNKTLVSKPYHQRV